MAIRRWMARRLLPSVSAEWPILPGSERPPVDWGGWPQGEDFAFVITHDVEGSSGLEKVVALAEIEAELGFRSAFNFVPEGEYRVPDSLRKWLVDSGFEVGVHDLRHDGHLYASRREFARNAKLINGYVDEWHAEGFRSGFMLNELNWLHDLHVRYDMSSFDTDPFEPQPKGAGTIFPYVVPENGNPDPAKSRLNGPGYVELPYTLPQDSTLFLLLQEKSNRIWKEKFEWIARNGGMALLNVHPDYIAFDDRAADGRTYPISYYREFLSFVKESSFGRCWQALPCEVADFSRDSAFSLTVAA